MVCTISYLCWGGTSSRDPSEGSEGTQGLLVNAKFPSRTGCVFTFRMECNRTRHTCIEGNIISF